MTLPSLDGKWADGKHLKPRIQVLEVRDRERPEREPIAWLLVEREEFYRYDSKNEVYTASISLSYQQVVPKYLRETTKGRFDGSYDRGFNLVSLTSNAIGGGAVFLDLPGLAGQRIGTYLMNEIVIWVKRWPEANVMSVELISGQADAENKERRNRFYEQFGLVFDYSDAEEKAGHSRPLPAKELRPTDEWKKNITELKVIDHLADALSETEQTSTKLERRSRDLNDCIAKIRRAEAMPIRWALRTLYNRYAGLVASWLLVAAILLAMWRQFQA